MEAAHAFVLRLESMVVLRDGLISRVNGGLKGGDIRLEMGDDVVFVVDGELMDMSLLG